MSQARFTPYDAALYATIVIAWGFSWIALHYQVGTVAPVVSVFTRFALAAPLMFAFAYWRGERLRFSLSEHLTSAALGLTLFSTNFALFYYGGERLPSGLLAVIFSLASVVNVIFGAIFLRMPIDIRVIAGALIGAGGVAAMVSPQFSAAPSGSATLIGLAFCAAGVLSFCTGNMVSAAAQKRGLPVMAASAWGMLYGSVALGLAALIRGDTFMIDWSPAYLGGLLYLAVIGSVIAFASYLTLLGRIGPGRAAYATVMFPVVALAVSTLLEGYRWTPLAIAGLVAVMLGNLLVLRRPS